LAEVACGPRKKPIRTCELTFSEIRIKRRKTKNLFAIHYDKR
jgi:hypothetical protein